MMISWLNEVHFDTRGSEFWTEVSLADKKESTVLVRVQGAFLGQPSDKMQANKFDFLSCRSCLVTRQSENKTQEYMRVVFPNVSDK
jgi:hypothetical protein